MTSSPSESHDLQADFEPPSPLAGLPHEASVDEACLKRVEQVLDATELAIAAVEREDQPDDTTLAGKQALAVSVLIPVYNEVATIRDIVTRVRQVGLHHEIIIVDDYSTDGTRDVLLELDRDTDIRVLFHGYNQGKGAALRTGLQRIRGDVVIIQDADLEYDPRDYDRLLQPIREGRTDVVYGSRYLAEQHQDPSWFHRFGNWLLTAMSNLTTGQRLTDMETCYKVFRRRVAQQVVLRQDRFGFEPEFTAKISRQGHRILEVPIHYECRGYQDGKKIGIRDGINAIWCILRYAWRD